MILKRANYIYTRTQVKKDKERMYIFTDNCDRTSGSHKIKDESEYSTRFGKKDLKYPSVTSALFRGLDNAYPITTQKGYEKGKDTSLKNWNDEDFDEFKRVIDDDFEHIKKACIEKGYKEIIFPVNGVLNSSISRITANRTPKLFFYIIEKEMELKNFNPNEHN